MSDFIIIVNGFFTNGKLSHKLSSYPDGKTIPEIMDVTPGDTLSWHVQIGVGGAPSPLPYTIHFFEPDGKTPDKQFFGVSSVSVPEGGTSPSLRVRALQSTIKYSILLPGLGTIDPQIQTGDGSVPIMKDVADSNIYAVTWNVDTNQLSYTVNAGASQPFPATLQVKRGDKMGFTSISAAGPGPAIQIVFTWDHTTNWASPFLQATNAMPTPAANPIAPMQVKDPGDRHAVNNGVFPFVLQPATGAPSNSFNLTLA